MATEAERLSRLETDYDHVATKAELEVAKGEFNAAIERVVSEIRAAETRMLKWDFGVSLSVATLAVAVAKLLP